MKSGRRLTTDRLRTKVVHQYPLPLALLYARHFDKGGRFGGRDGIDMIYFTVSFLGGIILSAYLKAGAPSPEDSLNIAASIKNMNIKKWVDLCKRLLPYIEPQNSIPEIFRFFAADKFFTPKLCKELAFFTDRIKVIHVPIDRSETIKMRSLVFKLFDKIDFLSVYSLVVHSKNKSFVLRGIGEAKPIDNFKAVEDGVYLITHDQGEPLLLTPFFSIKNENEAEQTNFIEDQKAYQQLFQLPAFSERLNEYKALASGIPDFTRQESHSSVELPPSFKQAAEEIFQLIKEDDKRKVLIEAPPGAGKTAFMASLDKLWDETDFYFVKYYFQDRHIFSSSSVFHRFFYLSLNKLLDNPHKAEFKDKEWQEFKKNVTKDFIKSGKRVLLLLDFIDSCINQENEKGGIIEFLAHNLPPNIYMVAASSRGDFPLFVDGRIKLPSISLKELNEIFAGENYVCDEELYEYYGGLWSFLLKAVKIKKDTGEKLPFLHQDLRLLFHRYDLSIPDRLQICRLLAVEEKPQSAEAIAQKLEISLYRIIKTLDEMLPVLKASVKGSGVYYSLFIPAFSDYVKEVISSQDTKEIK